MPTIYIKFESIIKKNFFLDISYILININITSNYLDLNYILISRHKLHF